MDLLGLIAGALAGVLLTCFVSALLARRRQRERAALRAETQLMEGELARILGTLSLAEESAKRLLQPGRLVETIERITGELVRILGVRGASVFLKPQTGQNGPTSITSGQMPAEEGERGAFALEGGDGGGRIGSILSLPIRHEDTVLGELRIAEPAQRRLTSREIETARLLAQLVGSAAEHSIQQNLLARLEEDKHRFILATTHDLRSPLQTIQQLIHVMLDGYAGAMEPKSRELLERIDGQADHLLDLVSDLLNLAMEDQGVGRLQARSNVSIAGIFDSQVAAARIACEARGILLSAQRPDGALPHKAVEGDIEKIFANLLSNAVKYTREGGRVKVALEESPAGILFRVRDTGIGIPKDSLPRVFTEFYRAPNAKEKERQGTGLGLVLVQKLVRKYGGKIRIESTEGVGTLVEVLIPPEEERVEEPWSENTG